MRIEKQFSVHHESKPHALWEVIKRLADEKVNILAFIINSQEGILRMVVDNPDKVRNLIPDAIEEPVLAMEIPHRPGSLAVIVSRIAMQGITIDYAYASGAGSSSLAILYVSDTKKALEILSS